MRVLLPGSMSTNNVHLIDAYELRLVCFSLFIFIGLSPFDTKLELQKHSANLDNQEQASVFEVAMVCGLKPSEDLSLLSSGHRSDNKSDSTCRIHLTALLKA